VQHWVGFISIWVFTGAFYAVYSQIRELVCTLFCPYGRLQGVLLDEHTLVVAYDDVRGEPRGKLSKNIVSLQPKGDCVDCGLCIEVCPTGIDIRNGTQLECINCTACIDVCNQVMDKIHKPHNLIGFFSQKMIHDKEKLPFTPRMIGYSTVITILMGVLSYFVITRSDLDVTILRGAGMLYQEQPGSYISNIYNAEFINKTDKPKSFFIMMPAKNIRSAKTEVNLQLMVDDKVVKTVSTTFIGPINN
jgi:cytochrome c oxidase accessory protein FixG